MSEQTTFSANQYTKILVPASSYNMVEDTRLLIPFTSGEKIGFANRDGIVVVKPKYTMYYGECYNEDDVIRVAVNYAYGFIRSGGRVASYQRPLFGLINSKGETLLEPTFFQLAPAIGDKQLFTAQNQKGQHGVLSADGEEIVPFGKYNWIDGFDKGLARVKIWNSEGEGKAKWGLIDETGKEVLPIEYDNIWNFYGKERDTTRVEKGNSAQDISLKEILCDEEDYEDYDSYEDDYDDYGTHYGEYAGTYAQDVAGYSDDVINDAFDGEPDAYWNID